ncbi:MAG TPA: hypothetical protein VH575_06470 [Gemmataceae bacterium]|jgi:hypothetical protein
MEIRTYRPGDEAAQVSIYNEAAGELPKFKAATPDEVRRRVQAADYDPSTRFLAVEDGQPIGYAGFHANGRVNYPWCRKGHEAAAQPLFDRVLQAMKERGLSRAFAVYRADWPVQQEFFNRNGFRLRREMVNFVLDRAAMPAPSARSGCPIGSTTPDDVPAILELGANVLQVKDRTALERHLFHNPYFSADAVFALRENADAPPRAVGIFIANAAYADPRQVDAAMPCFRLGAFGTEGMSSKRLNGLFSFLSADSPDAPALALDLMDHATQRRGGAVAAFGAQVPSDAGHLLRFYEQYFQRQASFPFLERSLPLDP